MHFIWWISFKMIQLSLFVIDFCRRPAHQILAVVALGEGDHVSDGVCLGDDGDQTVQAEGDAGVRGAAAVEGGQQVLQLAGVLLQHLLYHEPLIIPAMDSDTASPDFLTIQHQIVV